MDPERLTDEFRANGYLVLNDFFDHGLLPAGDAHAAFPQQAVLRPRKGILVLLPGPAT